MKKILFSVILLFLLSSCWDLEYKEQNNVKNKVVLQDIRDAEQEVQSEIINNNEKMLLVLAAPSVHDEYYRAVFDKILDFQVNYFNKVQENGQDDMVILVDRDTKKYYQDKIGEDYLIEEDILDIWMRDFTTVNPSSPVEFRYTYASMSQDESEEVQLSFDRFADSYEITRKQSELLLDGGNIVDDYNGRVITTTHFLKDNNLSYTQWKKKLNDILWAKQVAIIESDDEILGHSDGMVSWIDDNVLAVNDYSNTDPELHRNVIAELEESFPWVKIVLIPVEFDDNKGYDNDKGIWSACGININLVLTNNALYVPTFWNSNDKKAIDVIRKNTTKEIIEIDAKWVCNMGWSVRCLTWQVSGVNIDKILE